MGIYQMEKKLFKSISYMKFAFTGPESSGKTTLSKEISELFNGEYFPEYAREFLTNTNGFYSQNDLDVIAKRQIESWSSHSNLDQFYDTEILVIEVWSEFKYNSCSELIINLVQQQQIDHYFLCSPDIPYEEDPLRECPEQREELFEIYLQKLKKYKFPFTIIKGTHSERIKKTSEIILTLSK